MALACARVATPCGVAMHGVYLVSQGARTGGSQPMGLGMFYPPHVQWDRAAVDDLRLQTRCLLAVAPRETRETSVSYLLVTAVLTNIHMCFPYPLPRHPLSVLFALLAALASGVCACSAGCLTVASHTPITRNARTVGVTSFQKWFRYRNKAP